MGIPAGLVLMCMNICDFVRNYYFNIFGGQAELAAWGIVQKVGNAFMQICVGIAQGIRPVVSYNHACGLQKRVRSIMNGGFEIDGIVISQPIAENLTALVLFVIYLTLMKRETQCRENTANSSERNGQKL